MTTIDHFTKQELIAIAPWLTCNDIIDRYCEDDGRDSNELCVARWEDDGGRAVEARPIRDPEPDYDPKPTQ